MLHTNYDIFISFKDRDNDSNRTVASRLAEDIYDTLDVKGYSVFYSRFVLPGMVGGQYEPVINHALETAKLLVLVFTNADEVNSEWVKHEWKYFSKHDKPILTIFKDCGNARLENLPYVISQLQYCDLTDGSKRQYEFMLKRIDEIMSGEIQPSAPVPPRKEEKKQSAPAQSKASTPVPFDDGINWEELYNQAFPPKASTPAPRLNVKVGGKVTFGQYPQGENGEIEPLVWRVLAVENGRALLITDKLIDCVKYNEDHVDYVDVTWETCTLRKWMNNDFIGRAFNSSQQEMIATVTNQNPDNPWYGTKGGSGKATQDTIFLLSIEEAEKYFRDDDDRMAAVTEYAKKQEAYICDDSAKENGWKISLPTGEKTGMWWLRSPGFNGDFAAFVNHDGNISMDGFGVDLDWGAVRPAFWLNLK